MNKPLVFSVAAMAITVVIALTVVVHAYAQPTTTTTNATTGQQPPQQQVANLSKIFAQDKALQFCLTPGEIAGSPFPSQLSKNPCISRVDVLYQSPHTLGLSSKYVDIIWKAVDIAKTQGYKVDGITSYITRSSSDESGSVNVLMSMSR